jgi:hypothetical protein
MSLLLWFVTTVVVDMLEDRILLARTGPENAEVKANTFFVSLITSASIRVAYITM